MSTFVVLARDCGERVSRLRSYTTRNTQRFIPMTKSKMAFG